MDLYWTYHTQIPTEEEYFVMVDGSEYVFIGSLPNHAKVLS